MKIVVYHKIQFGKDRFNPANKWTNDFLKIFRVPSDRPNSFTKSQIDKFKELGFIIEIIKE